MVWDEEQRLTGVQNSRGIHHYIYDSKGERIMKGSVLSNQVAVNGVSGNYTNGAVELDGYLLYVNPYFVARHFKDWVEGSKHYYMGTQRIASETMGYVNEQGITELPHQPEPMKASSTAPYPISGVLGASSAWQSLEYLLQELGANLGANFWSDVTDTVPAYKQFFDFTTYLEQTEEVCREDAPDGMEFNPDCLCASSPYYAMEIHEIDCEEFRQIYWYHPDYLGHNEYITDKSGRPYQYFHYSAFGEVLVQRDANYGSFQTSYTFNAKEFDGETGLGYYGARYYNPTFSVWLGVDALASRGPNVTPYAFSHNNPIMLVDPDGNWPWPSDDEISPDIGNPFSIRELSVLTFEENLTPEGAGTGSGVDHISHTKSIYHSFVNENGESVYSTTLFEYKVDIDENGLIKKDAASMSVRTERIKNGVYSSETTPVEGFNYDMLPNKFKTITEDVSAQKRVSGRSPSQESAKRFNIAVGASVGMITTLLTGGLALPWQLAAGAGVSFGTGYGVDANPEIFSLTLYDSGIIRR